MKILSVNLSNYKSIKDSNDINLTEMISIFAGKNNNGKTAIIESIYKAVNASFIDTLKNNPNYTTLKLELYLDDEDFEQLNHQVDSYFISKCEKIRVTIIFDRNVNVSSVNLIESYYNNSYVPIFTNTSEQSYIGNGPEGRVEFRYNNPHVGGMTFGGRPKAVQNLIDLLITQIVFISGTRYVPNSQSTQLNENLNIDGTNLNAFLYTLHNNYESVFDKIKSVFQEIFNDVTSISTPINIGNETYISLYFDGYDKPIPLYNCGSGFTHVLLLLCILYSKDKCIVLFDEPHVYLHPSAEKAIYDLINETTYHQFILTTHSPILINYPFNKDIIHVSKEKGVTHFSQLNNMQNILFDLGVSNSDYALSDKVLFVEGETEEAIIPIILNHFGVKQIGYNYRILKMNGTGNEFIKKSAMTRNKEKLDMVLGGIASSPIPYKILIDSDEKNEEKISEIKDKYGESVIVLERREFENYYLDCYEEISKVINENKEEKVSDAEEIKVYLDEILAEIDNKKLYPRETNNPIINVVGSHVLEVLFGKYDLGYNKILHGVQITAVLLQSRAEKLEFLKDCLEDFIRN